MRRQHENKQTRIFIEDDPTDIVSEYWYLLFIKKKKKKEKEEGQYLQVSISFIVSHFPAPGVVK